MVVEINRFKLKFYLEAQFEVEINVSYLGFKQHFK